MASNKLGWFFQGMFVEWLAQLLFGSGGGVAVILSTLTSGLPIYAIVLLAIFGFIVVFSLSGIIIGKFWGKDSIRFFRAREDLQKSSRTLQSVVSNYKEVWALWISGTMALNDGIFDIGHVKKLILLNPYGEVIKNINQYGFNYTTEQLAPLIEQATAEAEKHGAEVKWLDFVPFMSLILGNPNHSYTEAQIEYSLAGIVTRERSSCLIGEQKYPEVIKRIRNSFVVYWEQSKYPGEVRE